MSVAPLTFRAGLRLRCPACGEGRLFAGLLKVADACAHCGQDLRAQDSGDGPIFFVLIIAGFLVVGLAAWVEIAYAPPVWLHMLLWVPFTCAISILLLRLFKSLLIACQYRHRIGFNGTDV